MKEKKKKKREKIQDRCPVYDVMLHSMALVARMDAYPKRCEEEAALSDFMPFMPFMVPCSLCALLGIRCWPWRESGCRNQDAGIKMQKSFGSIIRRDMGRRLE